MKSLFLVGIGGALGALSRYGIMLMMFRLFGGAYPLGTFLVNIVGSLFAGMLVQFLQVKSGDDSNQLYVFASIGFLGAFTTFSAFAVENVLMLESKAFLHSLGYSFLMVFFSLLAVFVGMRFVQIFLS